MWDAQLLKEKNAISKQSLLGLMHWIVIAISFLVTIFAWHFFKVSVEAENKEHFEHEATEVIHLFLDRLSKYEDALKAGVSYILALNKDISFLEWKAFAENLSIENQYPGINGIGVIHHIESHQFQPYLEKQRIIRPDYNIHPPHNKDEFWPISYIIPVDINKKAVGLDMAFESNRLSSAKKARDSGTTQITAPIILVQDNKNSPGFLMFVPFYDTKDPLPEDQRTKRFKGIVYAPFIFEKLIKGVLEEKNLYLSLKINDGNEVLYNNHTLQSDTYDPTSFQEFESDILVFGRKWTFHIKSNTSFQKDFFNNQPLLILVFGILIDLLLIVLFITLTTINKRALLLVDKIYDERNK